MANPHITFRGAAQPLIFVFLALLAPSLEARENAYDVLGKALVPLAKALISTRDSQSHAVKATLVLDSATNLPPGEVGDTMEIALQNPDKLRLHATVLGQEITICRNGQSIWGIPGSKIEALIESQNLPKPDPDFKLGQFHLPIEEKQLVWLPILFNVRDAGDEAVDGENCMVLDVTLMPDLARSLKAEQYSARLWVRGDYKIAKIELRKSFDPAHDREPAARLSDWKALISVKSLEYAASLPAETWQPTPEESADLLQITPARYGQLMDYVSGRWAAWKRGK